MPGSNGQSSHAAAGAALNSLLAVEADDNELATHAQQTPLRPSPSRPQLLERIVSLYSSHLRESRQARDYLQARGFDSSELWEAFRLGFSDGSLLDIIPQQGEMRDALVELGIVTKRGHELFSGCIVVPLEHPDHGLVNLYGRRVTPGAGPKHVFLPGPHRGALNWPALRTSDGVYITKSILDALSLWTAGCRNVTSLFSLDALPPDLDTLLGSFAVREVRFCFDGEPAAREAASRLATQLGRRGVRCWSVTLPDERDPNKILLQDGATSLRAMLERCAPLGSCDEPTAGAPHEVQQSAEGIELRFADVTYHVLPQPPFVGKLRARIRASRGSKLFLDTFDLYSDYSRARAANKLAARLGVLRDEAETHFLSIIGEAERWVEAAPDSENGEPEQLVVPKAPELSAAEKEEALAFLARPDLVDAILDDMQALGYVGEERSKLLAYLIGISRRLERPLSGIIGSQSGAGKSSLAEMVETLTPPEDVVQYARLSPQALAYMPKTFLKRRLLILEERTGGEAADYSIRVLQSKQKWTHAVVAKNPITGKMQTTQFEVEGPISYLETTTSSKLNHENTTRCFELGLDESEEQTRRIQDKQRRSRTLDGLLHRQRSEDIKRRHHNAQRLLEPFAVVLPFEGLLSFPTRWLRTRRDNERFLSLIDASAFLHQQQRPQKTLSGADGDIRYLEATIDDYRLAYDLAHQVLGTTLHELTRHAQELWEAVRALVCDKSGGQDIFKVLFARRELRDRLHWPDRRLREALDELVDMEYVAAIAGSQGKAYQYRLLTYSATTPSPLGQLTTPAQLEGLLTAATASDGELRQTSPHFGG